MKAVYRGLEVKLENSVVLKLCNLLRGPIDDAHFQELHIECSDLSTEESLGNNTVRSQ